MDSLLLDLEIDALCWEFLAHRIADLKRPGILCEGEPQPIVRALDAPPEEDDPDWDELTARVRAMSPAPGQETTLELTQRVLARMGL